MQVNSERIERFEDLIKEHIDKDKKIVETNFSRLTAPGENFGSTILKVDLLLKDSHGEFEKVSVVAKLIPESEFFQEVFSIQVTFNLESAFYEIIIPTLQAFQREQGVKEVIDFFPKYYGSRKNLDGGEQVDGNAVLLLENLKTSGKSDKCICKLTENI